MSAEDYLTLPDLVTDIVPVALNPKAAKAYREFEKNLLVEVDGEMLDAGSAAVLSGKLLQMANGAVYNDSKETVEVHDCKLEAFMEPVSYTHLDVYKRQACSNTSTAACSDTGAGNAARTDAGTARCYSV